MASYREREDLLPHLPFPRGWEEQYEAGAVSPPSVFHSRHHLHWTPEPGEVRIDAQCKPALGREVGVLQGTAGPHGSLGNGFVMEKSYLLSRPRFSHLGNGERAGPLDL